jgi:hypothetical protein
MTILTRVKRVSEGTSFRLHIFRRATSYDLIILGIYYIALFPGRPTYDLEIITDMMQIGESAATWSPLYFRLVQVLTLNGQFLGLVSFVGLFTLYFSFKFMLSCFSFSSGLERRVRAIVVTLPIFGFFGLTVNHDVFAVSGILLLTGLLIQSPFNLSMRRDGFIILGSVFLCSMSWLGIASFLGFVCALFFRRHFAMAFASTMILTLSVIGSAIALNVDAGPSNRWLPILGDLKCIAQDADSSITQSQWKDLSELASKEDWLAPASCVIADFAPDAAEQNIGASPADSLKLWAELTLANQKVVAEAHLQRAAVALPPFFSSPPPNTYSSDYLLPVGSDVPANLFQFSEFLNTSRDVGRFESPPKFVKPLEIIFINAAFLFNRTSSFWGWGGLWITVAFFLQLLLFRNLRFTSYFPLLFSHLLLLVASPGPISRYVFGSILFGLAWSVAALFAVSERKAPNAVGT